MLPLLLPAVLALGPTPAAVLHAWDEQRSAAWADGDVAELRSLYAPGSRAGRADAAMLRAWRARGLRVEGLRSQLLAVDVRRRTAARLVLEVTDRMTGGVAVPGGWSLPGDLPSRHVVTLRRVAGEWRVASVSATPATPDRPGGPRGPSGPGTGSRPPPAPPGGR